MKIDDEEFMSSGEGIGKKTGILEEEQKTEGDS